MQQETVYFVSDMCPLCKQGLQVLYKEVDTGNLFIYCDECEAEWLDIENISDTKSIIRRSGAGRPADKQDLRSHPWRDKVLNWTPDDLK